MRRLACLMWLCATPAWAQAPTDSEFLIGECEVDCVIRMGGTVIAITDAAIGPNPLLFINGLQQVGAAFTTQNGLHEFLMPPFSSTGTYVVEIRTQTTATTLRVARNTITVIPNPCVDDPLTFAVTRWPRGQTGGLRFDYRLNHPSMFMVDAQSGQATAVDARGCRVTVTR